MYVLACLFLWMRAASWLFCQQLYVQFTFGVYSETSHPINSPQKPSGCLVVPAVCTLPLSCSDSSVFGWIDTSTSSQLLFKRSGAWKRAKKSFPEGETLIPYSCLATLACCGRLGNLIRCWSFGWPSLTTLGTSGTFSNTSTWILGCCQQ